MGLMTRERLGMSTTTKKIPAIAAEDRTESGSTKVQLLRYEGKVPGQVYGGDKPNRMITVDSHELGLAMRDKPTMMTVKMADGDQTALIKDVQYEAVGLDVLHIEFQRVELDQPVEVQVPLDFFGTPTGAETGSRLEIMQNTVRIKVKAGAIPDSIRVLVAEIPVGTRFTFDQLPLPEGAELVSKPKATVCQVSVSKRALAAAKAAASKADKKGEKKGKK
jgi:large subunit ribosomal protein L25